MSERFASLAGAALGEIVAALKRVDPREVEAFVDAIASAERIVCAGVGREGLMMRALAMRLYHLGLDAHVAGDMTTPPVGAKDLLIVSAGPGSFATIAALVAVAADAGAATAAVTAQPNGAVPTSVDRVLTLPAQTMADDRPEIGSPRSVLPMGSLYEGSQFLAFEILVVLLREKLGVSPETMRANHTNLE